MEVVKSPAARADIAAARRTLFFGATFASALLASALMLDILRANGLTLLELTSLILFFVLFTWITGAFYTALAGFVIHLIGRDKEVLSARDVRPTALARKTVIVMPVYNEDPAGIEARVSATWASLQEQSEARAFDFFILSDTRDAAAGDREYAMWQRLVQRHAAHGRMFYRRRAENIGRKAGNLADFVRRWGAGYEHMVVLDADSVMSGHALVTLARMMEAHPTVGILQTLPMPVGRETPFARLIQFASRLNGPMLSSGLAFWQLDAGNYWGHNAIIRIRPFAQACALPALPGRAPLGGEILSHDFVEAAFMRRAGYEVWLVPDLAGSWEEVPSNLVDFAARDRRWAQGNMQHFKVLPMKGLHWLSRIHMLTGILSYGTSPIWLAVLVVSSFLTCLAALNGHQYFQPGAYVLFPAWPESRFAEIASLLTVTLVVLLMPKVLGATLALRDPVTRRGFGGARRLFGGLLIEQVFSILLAPAMMVFHATFVVSTLAGKPVAWNAQDREDRGIAWSEGLRRHRWHIVLGIVWGATILTLAPTYIWWMLPVIAGLLTGVALTVWTSRKSVGRALKRRGLLVTPEETSPPPELRAAMSYESRAYEPEEVSGLAVPEERGLRMEPARPDYPRWVNGLRPRWRAASIEGK